MPRKKNWGEPTRSSERLKEKDQRQAEERRRPKALDLSKPTEKNASEKEATIPISPPPDAPQRTDPYGGIAGLIKAFDQNSKIPPKQVAIVKRSLSGGSYNAPLEDPKKPKTGESPQEFGAERPQLDESRREGLSLPSEQGPHTTYQTIDINYNPGGGENLPMVSTHSARDILPSEASEQQHTEIERQRLKLLVNQTSELLQRSADFDFDMVIKISEVSEKTDKGNMSRQEIQDNYNEIKEHYLALGGDPTLLDERPFRAGSPVHPEQDHSLPMDLDDYDIDEGNDTGSQNSTRHGSPKIRYDAYVQSLRNERIPEVYGELRRKLEQASKLDNPNQELGEIIKEAQDLVDKHQTNFDALNELHDMHKENYKNLKDQYDLDLGELEELGLGEEQLKDQRKQLQQNFKEQTMDLKEKFQQSLELDYLGYTDQLEEYHDNLRKFTDPESDRPDSFHEQDSKPKATEVSKPEEVFSEDEVKCTFAVERAVTLGYFEYWRRDGIEQPDTEEFRKTYHSALELVGTDTEDLTSQNIGHLNKINKIFKECVKSDVEKDPQKFRLHLKQTLVDARNRIAWTDEFKEHFNIEENWVKDSIQKLGITSGNFDDGYIMLLTNESEISNDVVMSKKPMDEIIDSYQKSANADEIVSTYEKFMRGKVGLDSIHSQLRDGIPVDNRPSHIWNREVTFVSGEKNNCVPHSLLKGAHPEWSSDFIKLESEKAKNYVIKALKEKTRLYEEKVEEYMNEGSKHQEAKEQAANELEIFDVENLNIGSDDMLNPGGDTGRMLISYLRETKVTDPDSGKEVPLLDPDRPVLVYQLRNGRMSCTTKVEPKSMTINNSDVYARSRIV